MYLTRIQEILARMTLHSVAIIDPKSHANAVLKLGSPGQWQVYAAGEQRSITLIKFKNTEQSVETLILNVYGLKIIIGEICLLFLLWEVTWAKRH